MVIVVGARRDGIMRFRARLPQDTATLLLSASFVIVLVALAVASTTRPPSIDALSAVAAVCLLAIYGAWLWLPALRRAARAGPRGAARRRAAARLGSAAGGGGRGAAFASDWFVDRARARDRGRSGISQAFAGLVIVAIAGNAVENIVGVVLAAKGDADLAISVVKNSVAQIAVFLFPLLVLVSRFRHHLTFQLEPVYVGAILLPRSRYGRSPATARRPCSRASH